MPAVVILKPDAMIRRHVGARIVSELMECDYVDIRSFIRCKPSRDLLTEHYKDLPRSISERYVNYMSMSQLAVMLIDFDTTESEGIERLRKWKGGIVVATRLGTICGRYEIVRGVDCVHVSSSCEEAKREVDLWHSGVGLAVNRITIRPDTFVRRRGFSVDKTAKIREQIEKFKAYDFDRMDLEYRIGVLLVHESPESKKGEVKKLAKWISESVMR